MSTTLLSNLVCLISVRLSPDSYIGSVEALTDFMWVHDEGTGMNYRRITYVPGLFKVSIASLRTCIYAVLYVTSPAALMR